LKSSLRKLDRALDVLKWLHDCSLLYIAIFWLLPLLGLVFFSWLIADLRPILRGRLDEVLLYSLFGLPFWLSVCLYAEFSMRVRAQRLKRRLKNAPVTVGYLFLGGAGLLWLFGVIP